MTAKTLVTRPQGRAREGERGYGAPGRVGDRAGAPLQGCPARERGVCISSRSLAPGGGPSAVKEANDNGVVRSTPQGGAAGQTRAAGRAAADGSAESRARARRRTAPPSGGQADVDQPPGQALRVRP